MKLLNPATGEQLVRKIKIRVHVEGETYQHLIVAPRGCGFDDAGVAENLRIFQEKLTTINPTWKFQCVKTGFGCYNFVGINQ